MLYGRVAGVTKRVSRLVQGTMMLSGDEFRANAAALDITLTPEELEWLDLKRGALAETRKRRNRP